VARLTLIQMMFQQYRYTYYISMKLPVEFLVPLLTAPASPSRIYQLQSASQSSFIPTHFDLRATSIILHPQLQSLLHQNGIIIPHHTGHSPNPPFDLLLSPLPITSHSGGSTRHILSPNRCGDRSIPGVYAVFSGTINVRDVSRG
jgi:hypothetical protein